MLVEMFVYTLLKVQNILGNNCWDSDHLKPLCRGYEPEGRVFQEAVGTRSGKAKTNRGETEVCPC